MDACGRGDAHDATEISSIAKVLHTKTKNVRPDGVRSSESVDIRKHRTDRPHPVLFGSSRKESNHDVRTVRTSKRLHSPQVDKDRTVFNRMLREVTNSPNSRNGEDKSKRSRDAIARLAFVTALQVACSTSTRPTPLHSVPAIRTQLQAEFIHLHYARDGEDFAPSKLTLLENPDTASFAAATNALYLTQLASSNNDQKLLKNAMRSYQGALRVLRKDLSRPKACADDSIFATVHTMSLCEAFKGISLDDSGRKQHTKGVAMLFQGRGPKTIQGVYMGVQLQQHQRQALLDGLIARKRPIVGQGAWLQVRRNCHIGLTELTTLAMQVPGALEDADVVCSKGTTAPLDEILDMISNLKCLERDLQKWMTDWYTQFKVLPYWKVPNSGLSWLPKSAELESPAFTSALQFPTPAFAKAHVLFWMPLLALRQAIKDVAELHPYPLLAQKVPAQNQNLYDEIAECADNLCMTAMYLLNPMKGVDGYLEACDPLLLASIWYERVRDSSKLAWCKQMFRHIEKQGVRAPEIAHGLRKLNGRPP